MGEEAHRAHDRGDDRELNIPLRSGGSTTFKKELNKKGLEPDGCYW